MGRGVRAFLAIALIAAISVSGSRAAEKKEQALSPASISSRLFAYSFFQMNTLAEVSEKLRNSMRIARQQFTEVPETMRGVAADLSALEVELGAQVPRTPGRIPDWKNE